MTVAAVFLERLINRSTDIEGYTSYFEENIKGLQARGVGVSSLWRLLQQKRADSLYAEVTTLSRSWQSGVLLPVQAKTIHVKLQAFTLRLENLPRDKSVLANATAGLIKQSINEGKQKLAGLYLRENIIQLEQIQTALQGMPLSEIAVRLRRLTQRFTAPITGFEEMTLGALVYSHLFLIQTRDPVVDAADLAGNYNLAEAFLGIGKWPATSEQRAEAIRRALTEAYLAGAISPPPDRAESVHALRKNWGI